MVSRKPFSHQAAGASLRPRDTTNRARDVPPTLQKTKQNKTPGPEAKARSIGWAHLAGALRVGEWTGRTSRFWVPGSATASPDCPDNSRDPGSSQMSMAAAEAENEPSQALVPSPCLLGLCEGEREQKGLSVEVGLKSSCEGVLHPKSLGHPHPGPTWGSLIGKP